MTQESPSVEPSPDLSPAAQPSEASLTLGQALRRARFEDAERTGIQTEFRATQIGRLEMLHEALRPLLAQIPVDAADLFDVGLMPGATPRLFIDMIGFVEMGRDSRIYRLLQDTRHVRLKIAESADVALMVGAITQYIARRLLEREKALAGDTRDGGPRTPANGMAQATDLPEHDLKPKRNHFVRALGIAFSFVIDLLGALAFFAIVGIAGWLLWSRLQGRL